MQGKLSKAKNKKTGLAILDFSKKVATSEDSKNEIRNRLDADKERVSKS